MGDLGGGERTLDGRACTGAGRRAVGNGDVICPSSGVVERALGTAGCLTGVGDRREGRGKSDGL
jgi:hypothetical protein